jgi:hypothetical protein
MDFKEKLNQGVTAVKKYLIQLSLGALVIVGQYIITELSSKTNTYFNKDNLQAMGTVEEIIKEEPPPDDDIPKIDIEEITIGKKSFSFYDKEKNTIITVYYDKREIERQIELKVNEKIKSEKELIKKIKELILDDEINLLLNVEIKIERGLDNE